MKRPLFLIIISILSILTLSAAYFCFFREKDKSNSQSQALSQSQSETTAPAPEVEKVKQTNFIFAGDMMYDRGVYHKFKNNLNNIFAQLDLSIFKDTDIRFANLEGPISADPINDDPYSGLVFNFAPETINVLNHLSLNGVSLANNHTLNAGQSGFSNTQKVLGDTGIKFGGSQNSFDESSIIRYDTPIPVSIICVDYLAFNNLAKINAAIAQEKALGNFVIIFPHWGEEYQLNHVASQTNAAKSFIDADADLIIGGHPHVVEDIGLYNKKPIIYSLGNFVFDQTFSKDTQEGLIVKGKITGQYLEITLLPTRSISLQPRLMNEDEKNTILERIKPASGLEFINSDTFRIPR